MPRTPLRTHGFTLRFLALSGLAACTGAAATPQGVGAPSGGEPENTAPPENALEIAGHPGLEGCASADVEAELEVARAFDQSIHELVVCGGMAAQLSVSLLDVFINAAIGGTARADGWQYMGDGRWETGGSLMRAWFVLPFDTSWGRTGDVIPFDVTDPASYFADFSVVASATLDMSGEVKTDLAIEFTSTEPGFELLGVDQTPGQTSLQLDLDALVERLGSIQLRQDVVVEDERGDVTVSYHVTGDRIPLASLVFAAAPAPLQIEDAWAEHAVTGQRLGVTDWGMQYSGGSAGTLDGTIDVEVAGGRVEYAAHFSFPHRRYPDVTLDCR